LTKKVKNQKILLEVIHSKVKMKIINKNLIIYNKKNLKI